MKNIMGSIVSAWVVALAMTCFAADVEWLDAVDGVWGTAANWKGGSVPDGARAVITNNAASFTVTVAEASNPKIKGLLLKNAASSRTNTVHVTGHLSSQGMSNDDKNVAVQGGGLLHVDGGVFAITNSAAKYIALSGDSATKMGVLRVSGGLLDFRATSATINGGIQLSSNSRFEATGGRVRLTAPNAWNSGCWGLYCENSGAIMSLGGTVEVEIANRCVDLRAGSCTLSDSASLVCTDSNGNLFSLKASSSSGVSMTVQDNAELDVSAFANGYLGNYWWQGASYRSTMNVKGGVVKMPRSLVVADGNGTSVLNVSGGKTSISYYGLDVAAYRPEQLSSRTQNPAGTINVSGGSLVVSSAIGGQTTTFLKTIGGLVVGNGSQISTYFATAGYSCSGSLNVSGGVVTNGVGLFVIGAGRAKGSVMQTGGTVYHGLGFTTVAWRNKNPMVVGLGGGTGTYVISNGVTTVDAPVYVGGVVTNVFERPQITNWPRADFTDRTAVGTLVVAGGTLSTVTSDLVVGADGSGTLEIGPAGRVSVGNPNGSGNVILSNRTASVTRFVLGRDSAGQIATPNALIVADGAKLEVNATDYVGDAKWIRLVNCKRRVGSFAASDITVVGDHPRGGEYEIVQDKTGDSSGSIWLHRKTGSLIIVM